MKILATILSLLLIATQTLADITVFAAASTTDVMKELASAFEKDAGTRVRFNFASSGALARQIQAGAPADLFVSANTKWMEWLEEQGAVRPETRFNLAGNALVLAALPGSGLQFDGKIDGQVAVGDFRGVPAGMYAREALEHLGWMETLRPKLVMAASVRTALLYVERGEVAAGLVYATDAQASGKLEVIGTFPPESHSPILYPAAAITDRQDVNAFLDFLKTETATTILTKHGFTEPTKNRTENERK